MNFEDILGIGVSVGVAVFVIGAIVIGLAAFQASQTDNASNPNDAYSIIGNGLVFFGNLFTQLGTVGTIAGVMLILGVVLASLGGLLYGGYYLKNKMR